VAGTITAMMARRLRNNVRSPCIPSPVTLAGRSARRWRASGSI